MHISSVKNVVRVGQIICRADHDKKLSLVPDVQISREELKREVGRVYLITVNGVIQKIGGSQAAGGIQGTLGAYLAGFSKGMSPRTYCVWKFMYNAIRANDTVEVFVVFAPLAKAKIPTMTGFTEVEIPVDYHSIESAFVSEYVKQEGEYPYLNIQESGRKWKDMGELLEGYPGIIETGE